MRRPVLSLVAFALGAPLVAGCLVDRSEIAAPIELADAGAPFELDAALLPELDASIPPGLDAFVEPPDAALPPDAWVPLPDAYTPPVCTPSAETCNARDDDCDGVPDNDACRFRTTDGGSITCAAHASGRSVYLICPAYASWPDARSACQLYGYDLAVVTTAPESDAIAGWLRDGPTSRRAWIGLVDSGSLVAGANEGRFVWVDGTALETAFFGAGERSSSEGATNYEDCVELRGDGFWNDLGCGPWSGYVPPVDTFVCEAAIVP